MPEVRVLLDEIAACVDSGNINVEIDLQAGRVPSSPGWTVEVIGTPKATLAAEAVDGRVRRLDFKVTGGKLLVDGRGLRPDVFVESIRFEEGKGITAARFRGRGIWRPIVWIFRGLAMSALRKGHFRTDIPSIVRGEVLGPHTAAAVPGASFLELVREVRIHDSAFAAFGGRPLDLGDMAQFKTASKPRTGRPARVAVTEGVFRPAGKDRPAQFAIDGRLDGEVEDGWVAFVGGRSTFSHGELKGGAFNVRSGEDGKLQTAISAGVFALDLTSGQFRLPGGPKIGVELPSGFEVRDLRVRPDGTYSGIVDADLFGKVGVIDRGGTLVSASNFKMHTRGATIVDGRATGDVELGFDYRIDYMLIVHYPIAQIGDRRVPLVFEGPFSTKLHLQDASGDEGVVTGEYQFKVPWPPIEQAAFEVLRAKWSQDIPAVIRDVDFALEPRHFGPCGGSCFLVDLTVTVEKTKKVKGRFFQQVCDTEGKADLVVDASARRFVLRNVRIAPRCKGVFGWIVNVITPLLTTTYTDVTLFQMPGNLPFTIESVDSGTDWLGIAGKIVWASKATAATLTPAP